MEIKQLRKVHSAQKLLLKREKSLDRIKFAIVE